jgi:hypothetical protein
MAQKRIEITIDEHGNPTIEAFGYTGGECRLATEAFEEAAGKVKDRKVKNNECAVDEKVKVR